MKVSSIDKDLKSIFESGYYQIPSFQRPYSWEKENVLEFWNDISGEDDEEYFIGSMVVFKKEQGNFGIVDGQQRLTTLTVILSCLRDLLRDESLSDLARGVQNLISKRDINNKEQFIVQTETSYPFMHVCIQSFEPTEKIPFITDEEKSLKEAYDLVRALILEGFTGKNKKLKEKYLLSIRDKVLKLKVIFIELDNEDDAYIIFETLNTRGKDLEPSDLVKNHFSKVIKKTNSRVDRVSDKWKELLSNIQTSKMEIDINTFLYHYWLSKENYTTQKSLFKEFKKSVNQSNAKEHLDALLKESKFYRATYESSFLRWKNEEKGLAQSLEALSVFRVRQPLPLVLAILSQYFDKKLKLKNAAKFLSVIENFHFMHTAVASKRSSGGLSSYYAKKARELRMAKDEIGKVKVLEAVKAKLKEDRPKLNEFKISFCKLSYSEKYTKDKRLIQYILTKIDQKQRNYTPIDYKLMTIEHIMPQSDSEGENIISNIGNLIFVSSVDNNSKLKNKKFTEKKKVFLMGYSHLDRHILSASEWGQKEISKRSEVLAKEAFEKIWCL